MKAVILAGGLGTRISEESHLKPKPMITIGDKPILWHIMKIYSHHGINEFIVCLGYKGYVIKEYFANYFLHMSNVTFDIQYNTMEVHQRHAEPWKVTLIETGEDTMTGGRLKRVRSYLDNEDFCMTYGDGVSDVDIKASVEFHKKHKKLATVTAIQPPGRYGALNIEDDNKVEGFNEKPLGDGSWINGGFFILNPSLIDKYIKDDAMSFEQEPLRNLAKDGQLQAWHHRGFWQPMDTLRDKNQLEDLWREGKAPWKLWR
jgi:glucose-1-phosphate cytidylyltransferase